MYITQKCCKSGIVLQIIAYTSMLSVIVISYGDAGLFVKEYQEITYEDHNLAITIFFNMLLQVD